MLVKDFIRRREHRIAYRSNNSCLALTFSARLEKNKIIMIISKEREKRKDTIDVVVRMNILPSGPMSSIMALKTLRELLCENGAEACQEKEEDSLILFRLPTLYSFLFSAAYFFPSTFLPRMINENELIFVVIKETASRWLSLPTSSRTS